MPKTLNVTAQEIVPEFVQLMRKGKGKSVVLATTIAAVEKLATMYQKAWISAAQGENL